MSTQTFTSAQKETAPGVVTRSNGNGQFSATTRPGFRVLQPPTTHTGATIRPLQKGLPKLTQSLCPECTALIDARISEENGRVVMEKTCAQHGYFKDTVFSDARLYLKLEQFHFGDNKGVSNPGIPDATRCPEQCGLCSMHSSHTVLANLDLTNRCNLTCPVCFANANAAGYVYEPDFEQVRKMLQALRDEAPVAGRIVQFSGGEPTIHPRFHEICALARDMGFSHVQAATNGILLADEDFAGQAKENGLTTIYLQFDGVSDDVYLRTRAKPLLEQKLRCVENCRKVGIKICLVPTIVRGINDHQIGDIVRFALAHVDTVSAISFQPVTFTGRINRRELEKKRYTMADVAHAVEEQTGLTDSYHDWFPLACVAPFSRLVAAFRGEGIPTLSCHPHCALGTYLYVQESTGKAIPVTRFMDIGGMLQDMDELSRNTQAKRLKVFNKVRAWNALRRNFHRDQAPDDLTFTRFLNTLQGYTDKRLGRDGMDGKFSYRTLLVAGMHFMDSYNYDVERVKRCVIHYTAPDGLIYPFCAYNSGPCFREKIERKYSVPLEKPDTTTVTAG